MPTFDDVNQNIEKLNKEMENIPEAERAEKEKSLRQLTMQANGLRDRGFVDVTFVGWGKWDEVSGYSVSITITPVSIENYIGSDLCFIEDMLRPPFKIEIHQHLSGANINHPPLSDMFKMFRDYLLKENLSTVKVRAVCRIDWSELDLNLEKSAWKLNTAKPASFRPNESWTSGGEIHYDKVINITWTRI